MAKYELTKSIEAQKISKRTGLAIEDAPNTVPYAAILADFEDLGDTVRFTYMNDRYQCKAEVVRGFLHEMGGAGAPAAPAPPPAAPPPAPAQAVATPLAAVLRDLVFEPLPARGVPGGSPIARARIPGGWLVAAGSGGGVAFVPDPNHWWDGGSR